LQLKCTSRIYIYERKEVYIPAEYMKNHETLKLLKAVIDNNVHKKG